MPESTVMGHLVKWWIYPHYWPGIYKAKKCCCMLVTQCWFKASYSSTVKCRRQSLCFLPVLAKWWCM